MNSRLYTINPSTGAVVRNVAVSGGSLIGLGARIPEPTSAVLLAMGVLLIHAVGSRRRTPSRIA
jgi:hypothetical protein